MTYSRQRCIVRTDSTVGEIMPDQMRNEILAIMSAHIDDQTPLRGNHLLQSLRFLRAGNGSTAQIAQREFIEALAILVFDLRLLYMWKSDRRGNRFSQRPPGTAVYSSSFYELTMPGEREAKDVLDSDRSKAYANEVLPIGAIASLHPRRS